MEKSGGRAPGMDDVVVVPVVAPWPHAGAAYAPFAVAAGISLRLQASWRAR